METTTKKQKQKWKLLGEFQHLVKPNSILTEEDKKAIQLYGKQVSNSFVGENLSKKEKELLVGMALQAFEDGLIFNKKINTKK